MWTGGVRIILLDNESRMLMVRQHHDGKDIWMVPGGGIEDGEDSVSAALRELEEETGIAFSSLSSNPIIPVEVNKERAGDPADNAYLQLIWHVEEVSERGQRFVNYYLGYVSSDDVVPVLGHDPEFDADGQVLREVRFMSKEEIASVENLYPEALRDEFWQLLEGGNLDYNAFRKRK